MNIIVRPKTPETNETVLPYRVELYNETGFQALLAAFQCDLDAISFAKHEASSGVYRTGVYFRVPGYGKCVVQARGWSYLEE